MKKITCVGYHATGSGAVDDFLREFDNIEAAKYGVECRFLQDPDGISDLEYNLFDNPHRLNSGYALKRFLQFAKFESRSYGHIFGKNWINWAQSYIDELSEFSYKGYWHGDIRLLSPFSLFIYKARRAINKVMPKPMKKSKYFNYFPNLETYFIDIEREKFLEITQKKCEELCYLLNTHNKEYVVLDQVVSPQNINRYLQYINDLKVIVVDRDPRDVYLNDIIKNKDSVLPKEIHNFCKVYRMSRKNVNGGKYFSNVLYINFEDMIYKYEETVDKIMVFLGLSKDNHVSPKQYFNPDLSKKNTKMWDIYKEYKEDIQVIELELSEFLYTYDKIRSK